MDLFERGEILIARFDKSCELLWTARGPLRPAMVTVVGIFDIDNAPDMDKAVERLAAAGFDDTVYDEAIVPEDTGAVAPVFGTLVRAFKTRLAHYELSGEVIEEYAAQFYRNSKFVLVRTDTQRAEQVIKILRDCGASRVNRHD